MLYYLLTGIGAALAGFVGCALLVKSRRAAAVNAAERVREEARKESEHILREARVAAKSESLKLKEEIEDELKERRKEQISVEKRLSQREENLDKRADMLEGKMRQVEKQEAEASALREKLASRNDELQSQITRQIDELERIAMLDRESAKKMLLEKLKNEVKNESGLMVRDVLEEAKEKAEREAQRILSDAIQRDASACT